jgi:hypothetical protein
MIIGIIIIGIVNLALVIFLIISSASKKEMRKTLAFLDEKLKQQRELYDQLNDEYQKGYDNGYKQGCADMGEKQGWSVQIFPWKEDTETGFIMKTHTVKIGYKYQLFINGIPCFPPHVETIDTLSVNKLDKEAINAAVEGVKEAINAVANIHPAIRSVGDASKAIAQPLYGLIGK